MLSIIGATASSLAKRTFSIAEASACGPYRQNGFPKRPSGVVEGEREKQTGQNGVRFKSARAPFRCLKRIKMRSEIMDKN